MWETRRAEMGAAIARHCDILDEVIGVCGGVRPVVLDNAEHVLNPVAAVVDAIVGGCPRRRGAHHQP